MHKEECVSLWLGTFHSQEEWDAYIGTRYFLFDDEEDVSSPFEMDFQIEHHDEDFRDAAYLENASRNLAELLAGISYHETVIPKFVEKYGDSVQGEANIIILLYDYAYEGKVKSAVKGMNRIWYVGTVEYK
jgi:hypothetical protein